MKNIEKIFLLILITVFYSCNDPYENSTYQVYDVNPVSTYLESRPNDFSEWVKVLKYADLFNAVNQATEAFTVFVPNNKAMQAFYKKKGVSSIEELGSEYARGLAQYHIIADSIGLDKFILGGKLEKRTLSDDYLSVTFDETEDATGGFNSVSINKEAHVKELAVRVSNGFVYVLDNALSPLVETVYQRVEESGKYNIFKEVLDLTSWGDSVNTIYDEIKIPGGAIQKQKRDYTLMAVADETFQKDGITSVADLVRILGAENNYKEKDNELFRYMAYHIIRGNYSLFDFHSFDGTAKKKIWETMSGIVIEISQEQDNQYYLNYAGKEVKAQFIDATSDVQAKNGMLHQIDGYLPIWESIIPTEVLFDFCNYPEVSSYIKSNGTAGQVYQTEGTAEYRTEVTNLSCYKVEVINTPATPTSKYNYVDYFTVKNAGSNWIKCQYKDQLILNIGYLGSIEMKTPVLIAGKYKVTLHFCYATSMDFMRTMKNGSNGGKMQFSFDGDHKVEIAPYPTVSGNSLDVYKCVAYDELEFSKTGAHNFKIVVMDTSAGTSDAFRIQLDYLLFEPIINENE